MKYLYILCAMFLFSCQKSIDKIAPQQPRINGEKETCSFDISEFNMIKRPPINYDAAKGRPITAGPKAKSGGGSTTTNTTSNVILLDFNGQLVSGTSWNYNGDINCLPSNLTEAEQAVVFQRIATDFNPFNIVITTDENVYNNANPYKRMRVIFTESWEWFGQAGGVSFINSFTWGDNTPCFVFSSLLGYNVKRIAEAGSHEAGHTLGLRHQSVYDANGAKIAEYNPGQGSGEIGWAPIMGVSYSRNLSLWHNGTSSSSYTSYQNDIAIISGVVGLVNDDYSNTTSGAAALSSTLGGLINSSSDVDFFSINITGSSTVSVIPQNVGINNEGGNLDLILSVYNGQGSLIATINDPNILSASTVLQPGSYFVSVSTSDNSNTLKYGMLSSYSISIN
ncbi:MAG TPA: DVUA0089 family protein [Chitinophagaceae bacterium]|nr:DVUA0089 family protein [Chitinophagaceae bacterium]